MPKRRLILILLACGGLAGILWAALSPNREPSYQGISLTKWAAIYTAKRPGNEQTPEAIRHIGTNALPYLLDWIRQPTKSPWQLKLAKAFKLVPQPLQPQRLEAGIQRPAAAIAFFGMLGPAAKPAVPELTRLAAQDDIDSLVAYHAMAVLTVIGRDGFPPLFSHLTNRNQTVRHNVAALMRRQGTNACPAVPVLIRFLSEPDTVLARISADTLGFLGIEPTVVVPALTACLQHPDREIRASAAMALGRFGKEAGLAVGPLTLLLTNEHRRCRIEATNALRKIARETLR